MRDRYCGLFKVKRKNRTSFQNTPTERKTLFIFSKTLLSQLHYKIYVGCRRNLINIQIMRVKIYKDKKRSIFC